MKKAWSIKFLISIWTILLLTCGIFAQEKSAPPIKSQEVSEIDGIPVLVKHLPNWENAQNNSTYILNQNDLRNALGERAVFDLIDFAGGTEAVTAPYNQGKLLIIEFTTPQASVDADNKIRQRLAEIGQNPPIFYRRIGNYNAFVFDGTDETSANTLLDQVKYEKTVQWLGENPFTLRNAERAFILTTSDIFLTTVLVIVGGIGGSFVVGIVVGIIFFYIRNQKRAGMAAFSDAGGMIRLNLDGFTPEILPDRLLED